MVKYTPSDASMSEVSRRGKGETAREMDETTSKLDDDELSVAMSASMVSTISAGSSRPAAAAKKKKKKKKVIERGER